MPPQVSVPPPPPKLGSPPPDESETMGLCGLTYEFKSASDRERNPWHVTIIVTVSRGAPGGTPGGTQMGGDRDGGTNGGETHK